MKHAYCGKEVKGTKKHIISSANYASFPQRFRGIWAKYFYRSELLMAVNGKIQISAKFP